MRVLITGHKGFIARNLPAAFERLGHEVVPPNVLNLLHKIQTGEHCVHRNSEEAWHAEFERLQVDVVVHNAATVGTDVVALNPHEATLTNVTGTYNICRAASKSGAAVLYLGTTVIYDTDKYQEQPIVETSSHAPRTFYGAQKLAGEHIVRTHSKRWATARPLFCYGGVGDNNSLISKTLFGAATGRENIDIFLDPEKVKDYMHVTDFCDAVATVAHQGLWNDDWNVSAETPHQTGHIVDMMSEVSGHRLDPVVRWHPQTDYLGNHRLSSQKFRAASGWAPKVSLVEGIQRSWDEISKSSNDFNPLQYLDDAASRGLELTQFFNR
jgi:nucleoside-diphosphate-sugar epimerase